MEKPNNTYKQISYFATIPAPVRYSKAISNFAKLLYAEISCLTNAKGYCFALNAHLAELYQVHKNTISAAIKELEDAGFIRCDYIYTNKAIDQRRIFLLINTELQNKYEVALDEQEVKRRPTLTKDPTQKTVRPLNQNSEGYQPKQVGVSTKTGRGINQNSVDNVLHLMSSSNVNNEEEIYRANLEKFDTNDSSELFTAPKKNEVKPTCYSFEEFFNDYGKKLNRHVAEQKYNKLTEKERLLVKEHVKHYVKQTPDPQYRKHPTTYINQKVWLDGITPTINLEMAEKEERKVGRRLNY